MGERKPLPTLLVINGVPGAGKTTLARSFVQAHPMALLLDLDTLRQQLGAWKEHLDDAHKLTRRLGLVMTEAHLAAGHHVVIPQLLGRIDYLHQLESICQQVGARLVEALLSAPPEEAAARVRRREASGRALQPDLEAIQEWQRRVQQVTRQRPRTLHVDAVEGQPEVSWQQLQTLWSEL